MSTERKNDTVGGCLTLLAEETLWGGAWFFAFFGYVPQPTILHLLDALASLTCLYVLLRIKRASDISL